MKEAGNIRVLLMTTDYQSYFHPRVTALRDGKEIVCSFENMAASEEPVVIPAHENGIQLTSIQKAVRKSCLSGKFGDTEDRSGIYCDQ